MPAPSHRLPHRLNGAMTNLCSLPESESEDWGSDAALVQYGGHGYKTEAEIFSTFPGVYKSSILEVEGTVQSFDNQEASRCRLNLTKS